MFWISSALTSIGFLGLILFKKNLINSIFSIELMILGSIINFCSIGAVSFSIIILIIAAAEAALGFTICFFAQNNKCTIEETANLKD